MNYSSGGKNASEALEQFQKVSQQARTTIVYWRLRRPQFATARAAPRRHDAGDAAVVERQSYSALRAIRRPARFSPPVRFVEPSPERDAVRGTDCAPSFRGIMWSFSQSLPFSQRCRTCRKLNPVIADISSREKP